MAKKYIKRVILYQIPHHSRIRWSRVSGLEFSESYGSGIWAQILCCHGYSWGSRWYPWIQGWWCFWEVITLCPFSKFGGWSCVIILYFGCFVWAFQVWFLHRRFSSSFQAFPSICFSFIRPCLYYLQLFAPLAITGLNFCLLLSLNYSMLGIVGVWNRSCLTVHGSR